MEGRKKRPRALPEGGDGGPSKKSTTRAGGRKNVARVAEPVEGGRSVAEAEAVKGKGKDGIERRTRGGEKKGARVEAADKDKTPVAKVKPKKDEKGRTEKPATTEADALEGKMSKAPGKGGKGKGASSSATEPLQTNVVTAGTTLGPSISPTQKPVEADVVQVQAKDKATKADKGRTERHEAIHAETPGKGEGPSASLETKNVDVSARTAGPALGGKGDGKITSSTKKKVALSADKDDASAKTAGLALGGKGDGPSTSTKKKAVKFPVEGGNGKVKVSAAIDQEILVEPDRHIVESGKKKSDPEKGIQGVANVSRTRSSKAAPKDKEKSPQESSHSAAAGRKQKREGQGPKGKGADDSKKPSSTSRKKRVSGKKAAGSRISKSEGEASKRRKGIDDSDKPSTSGTKRKGGAKKPYIELFVGGKTVRQCRASATCPQRNTLVEKRVRMMDHLKRVHGLTVDIPIGSGGRPTGSRLGKNPRSSVRDQVRAADRFHDVDRKYNQNLKMCASRAQAAAEEAWQCIPKKQQVMKKKDFVRAFTMARVEKFEEHAELKKAVSQLRVQQGYEKHRRIKWTPEETSEEEEDSEPDDKTEDDSKESDGEESSHSDDDGDNEEDEDDEEADEEKGDESDEAAEDSDEKGNSDEEKTDDEQVASDEQEASDEQGVSDEEGGSDDDDEGSKHGSGDEGGPDGGGDEEEGRDDGDSDKDDDAKKEGSDDGGDEGNDDADDYYISIRKGGAEEDGGDDDDDVGEEGDGYVDDDETLSAARLLRHMRPLPSKPRTYPTITLSGPPSDPDIDVGMCLQFHVGICGSVEAISLGSTYSPPLTDIAEWRLARAKSILFVAVRTPSIVVEVDNDFIYDLLVQEASTRAVNLFSVWMINTLSNACVLTVGFIDSLWYLTPMHSERRNKHYMGMAEGLDFLSLMFVFLPVLIRGHWCLFVLYNNSIKRVSRLPNIKPGILFYDPLSIVDEKDCLPQVYRFMQTMATVCSDSTLADLLEAPEMGFQFERILGPQQENSTDCGFYVMLAMKHLVEGANAKKPPKQWLSRKWFSRGDCIRLRSDLKAWTLDVLEKL